MEYEQVTNNSIGIVINSWIDLSLTGGNNVTFEYDITRFGVVNKFGLTACNGGRCVVKKIYLLK